MSPVLIIALGCLAVLLLDAVGALASARLRFPYAAVGIVTPLIYAGTGFLAADAAGSWAAGAAGGAAAAAIDATVGWRVARALGVQDPRRVTDRQEAAVATAVTLSGAVLGALAGLAA